MPYRGKGECGSWRGFVTLLMVCEVSGGLRTIELEAIISQCDNIHLSGQAASRAFVEMS